MKPRVALVAAVAVLGACKLPVPFADDLLFTLERPQLPRAEDCKRCHGAIYREWTDSAHAGAWTRESFIAITADHAATDCLPCHAPAPLGPSGEVRIRTDHLDEGVTCISCHLSPEPDARSLTMRGPHATTSPVEVHPVVTDPLFQKPDLCGRCHESVLEEWKASPEPSDGSQREICQDCHMPKVHRRMETYDPSRPYSAALVALGDKIDGRRHVFAVPEDPWEDLELVTERTGGTLQVRITNKLPHGVPTGAFGRREARLRVRWPDGEALRLLRADLDQAIPAGESRLFELTEVPPAVPLEVVLERFDPRDGRYVRLAPAPPDPSPSKPEPEP
ncbi:MAG: multiheme c-type cytochrome [Myxococcota bacterium]